MAATISQEQTYWERVAESRWGRYTTEIARNGIMRAHRLASPPADAFEIGCEGGRWAKLLADQGWQMICTDVDAGALRVCQDRIPEATCILVRPEDTRLPYEEKVRLLLCLEVVNVIQSPWFIGEAGRILEHDGVLIGVFWNGRSLRGLLYRLVSAFTGRSFSFYTQAYPTWRRQLELAGFRIQYEEGYCWFPFSRGSNSFLIPFCIRLERLLRLNRLIAYSPWVIFIARKSGQ